jgi:hypothetical protein
MVLSREKRKKKTKRNRTKGKQRAERFGIASNLPGTRASIFDVSRICLGQVVEYGLP